MEWLEALILGIIQGLTEYLPVSSSGHLEIGKELLGVEPSKNPAFDLTFSVVVHFATVLSTVVIFWKDILQIFKGLFQFKWNEEFQFSVKIIISMIPAAIIGIAFEDQIDTFFMGNILLVGFMLWVTGLLLFLADKAKATDLNVTYPNALIIGIAQAIALLPGISRSGATISTSVLLKIDRERAARFSFLMVIPLIVAKVAKDLMSGEISFEAEVAGPMLIGFLAAFVVGVFACKWMLEIVKRGKLVYFSIYCFIVGLISIVYALM
ncbi:MAG: undecaprenyl-diphosphatase UppP [Aureispira sp.]|nr:undecaprenyl-diphosphatase UppP [Aureispira sp.]